MTIPIIYLFLLLFISCAGQQQKTEAVEAIETKMTFSLPEVPSILHSPEARAQFISEHYWDNFDFADTASSAPWSSL